MGHTHGVARSLCLGTKDPVGRATHTRRSLSFPRGGGRRGDRPKGRSTKSALRFINKGILIAFKGENCTA